MAKSKKVKAEGTKEVGMTSEELTSPVELKEMLTEDFDKLFKAESEESDIQELPKGDTLVYKDKDEPEDELTFLYDLLDKQIVGGWHGPAEGMIKERITQIKNK